MARAGTALPAGGRELADAAVALSARMRAVDAGFRLPLAPFHGDWVPWNLGWDGDTLWAWDLEYGSVEGPLGLDALRGVFLVEQVARGRSLEDAVAAMRAAAPGLLPRLGARPEHADALIRVHLLELVTSALAVVAAGRGMPVGLDGAPDVLPAGRAVTGVSVVVPTRDRDELLARAVTAIAAQEHDGAAGGGRRRHGTAAAPHAAPLGPDLPANVTLREVPNTRSPGLPRRPQQRDPRGRPRPRGLLRRRRRVAARQAPRAARPGRPPGRRPRRHGDHGRAHRRFTIRSGHPDRRGRDPNATSCLACHLLDDRIMALHPSGFLLRRADLLGSIGLVDEELAGGYGEDYDLLLRAAAHGPVVAVPEPLVQVALARRLLLFQPLADHPRRARDAARQAPVHRLPARDRADPRPAGSRAGRDRPPRRGRSHRRPGATPGAHGEAAYLVVAVAGGVLGRRPPAALAAPAGPRTVSRW